MRHIVGNISGIYVIICLINNKMYVGSAVNIRLRWNYHKSMLNLNEHFNKHLQAAWNKYESDNFIFEVLEFTENLIEKEQYWIDKLNVCNRELGYNCRPIANSNFGKKFGKMSDDHKKKIGLSNKGKKRSKETIENMSISQKGKKLSKEHKLKLSKIRLGFKHTEETKKKMSIAKRKSKFVIISGVDF
jgi:group I intron endonuclease